MEEKRTKIYPYSLRLQRSPNGVHILKDIISSIKKETRGNPRESIGLLIIEKGKLPTNNTEIRLPLQLLRRRLIRNSNASKHILLIIVVSRRVDKRIYGKLTLLLTDVYDEVRTKKHEICELISLCPEASHY